MSEQARYFRCNKCNEALRMIPRPSLTDMDNMAMCTRPVTYRTSGICGGSFSIEITEQEYNTQLKEWEEKRKNT